jgi:hypothetical protein
MQGVARPATDILRDFGSSPRRSMPADYLHNHPQFADLLRIVAQEKGIDPALVEKDYYSVSDVRFISTGVGRVRFNPPSRVEWRVAKTHPRPTHVSWNRDTTGSCMASTACSSLA